MANSRKKCPQIYWSQTDNNIKLIVDLLLDDMVSCENSKERKTLENSQKLFFCC